MRFTVGAKLAIGFSVVALLMVVNVGVGLNGLNTVIRTFEDDVAGIIEAHQRVQQIELIIAEQAQAMMAYLITLDMGHRQRFIDSVLLGNQMLDELRQTATEDEAVLIDDVLEAKANFERLASPLMEQILSQQQLRSLLSGSLGQRQADLLQATKALLEFKNLQAVEVQEQAKAVGGISRSAMIIMAAATIAVALLLDSSSTEPFPVPFDEWLPGTPLGRRRSYIPPTGCPFP